MFAYLYLNLYIIYLYIIIYHITKIQFFFAWGTVPQIIPQTSLFVLCLKQCLLWTPALWFTEKLNTYNLIMMGLCQWQISVGKRGFLGTTRLQIIYTLQFFSNCGLPNISVSVCQLISSGTGIRAQYHRIVLLISCNCTSLENTRQPTTKHNWVCISWNERDS